MRLLRLGVHNQETPRLGHRGGHKNTDNKRTNKNLYTNSFRQQEFFTSSSKANIALIPKPNGNI